MIKRSYILCSFNTYLHLLSSYTHSMTLTVECTHSTVKPFNIHIQWLLASQAIESTHSMVTYIQYNIYKDFANYFS